MSTKKIINDNSTNPHQIIPIKYQWAREYYLCGIANTWIPEEISMIVDIEQWKSNKFLTSSERNLIIKNLSFFSTAESLTANNIVLSAYKHITNPECRQYMLRQAFEEAVHTDTFIYCCESLGLNPEEIYTAYLNIPSIKEKDTFVIKLTSSILDPNFKTNTIENIKELVKNLIGFYVIMEGIFFYAGFAMILAIKRQNKMVGIGQQFEYIMRDESIHLAYGCDVIMTIINDYPEIWTKEFKDEISFLIDEAVKLEILYIYDACEIEVAGINQKQFCNYIYYIADRRLERLGLNKIYNIDNPFIWMSQSIDLPKEKNFFETKVTEYQTASSLEW